MPALKENITIEQGATFQREYTCVHEDTGEPMDFTGYAVTGELKTLAGLKVADFTVSVTDNKVLVEFSESDSLLLSPTTRFAHRYVVMATKAAAPDYRIAQGVVLVSAE